MSIKCREIINIMENIAPTYLAQEWDNVGLQIGSKDKQIKRILVCLEVNKDIVNEVVEKEIDMIIAHHPLIFKPLKKIDSNDPISRVVMELIKNDINLYCAHTNLDIAKGGTSDYLAKLLGVRDMSPLTITYNKKYYKLVVFVPQENVNEVRNAISNSGAGNIGNYSHCTFQTSGKGTFKPLEGSNPYIGNIDNLETVDEYRLEAIVPVDKLCNVLNEMIIAHPYEEVAYDLIPLGNKIKEQGFGRVGYLEENLTLKELSIKLKNKLDINIVKYIGDKSRTIQKVAICTGSGADFIRDAYNKGCDCYITGDVKYHEAQFAKDLGISIIDGGHYETEHIITKPLKEYLKEQIIEKDYNVKVLSTEIDINPFNTI